jgi:iron-sulfur cluster repair protein YtfE (RIC family)
MDPMEARHLLLAQHRQLRKLLEELVGLACRYVSGEEVAIELERALGEVRTAFDEHNRFESGLLEPLLRATGAHAALRLNRMVEEHVEEHHAFVAFLARPATELADELPEFAEELQAHIEAEERTFLSPQVLRPR